MTFRVLKFSVSLAILGLLVWWSDPGAILAQLRGAEPAWIGLALTAVTLATLSMARRWQLVARRFDIYMEYGIALREYYFGQLVNATLPGGVAGDVARAVRARGTADLTRAAQSVAAERVLGQIAMLGVMGAGMVTALAIPGGPEWAGLGWGVLAVLVALVLASLVVARTNTATGRFVGTTVRGLRSFEMLFHGLFTTFCLILGFYAAARAVGTAIPMQGWATLIPLVLCAMLIPLSINGWGWREGAAAALFPVVGFPASTGVAAGITYGVVLFISVLPGVLILITQTYFNPLPTKGHTDPT
ncbi:MAG: lysylphosphatidylglycerol synthase transmembrane domain-containing protein [Pseudomonadota bacterium]